MRVDDHFYSSTTIFLHTALIIQTILNVFHEQNHIRYFLIILLLIVNILSLYKTTITDPGYIKGNRRNPSTLAIDDNILVCTKPHIREILIDGELFVEKFCNECFVYTNEVVFHCRYCDSCVYEQDHHCVWINNCIGINNFKYFMWSINSTMLILIYNITKCKHYYFKIIDAFYLVVFVILCSYYWFLVFFNIRGRDFLKNRVKKYRIDLYNVFYTIFGLENELTLIFNQPFHYEESKDIP